QMLQTAMSGTALDDFRDGEETVSIVAREPDASRSLLSAVNSVYVPTDFGGFVPVSQVAKVVPASLTKMRLRVSIETTSSPR
ncbi:hypothetical protein ACCT09_56580, partial [Rhizobium ruizarguesonis]